MPHSLIGFGLSLSLIGGVSPTVIAKTYLSSEEALHIMFPGKYFSKVKFEIPSKILKELKKKSGIHHSLSNTQYWLSKDGSWFIVDEVVGKHEMITYALGINNLGMVKDLQILQYQETYGHQVREKHWRSQFIGKTGDDSLLLNQDIINITGATLSCKHVTDGVRRLMNLYLLLLKNLSTHESL